MSNSFYGKQACCLASRASVSIVILVDRDRLSEPSHQNRGLLTHLAFVLRSKEGFLHFFPKLLGYTKIIILHIMNLIIGVEHTSLSFPI